MNKKTRKIINWLLGKEDEELPRSNIQNWDESKAQLVYNLLSKRYDDEIKIGDAFQKKASFFLTTLGVILTLILTITIPQISEWHDESILPFILIMFILGLSVAFYFLLYMNQNRFAYPKSRPTNQDMEWYLTDEKSTKLSILKRQIEYLYKDIAVAKKKNFRTRILFVLVDSFFMVGLICTIGYALHSAQLSQIAISFIIILLLYLFFAVIFVLYAIQFFSYRRFIIELCVFVGKSLVKLCNCIVRHISNLFAERKSGK